MQATALKDAPQGVHGDLLARMALQYEVEQFLYHEAALLDARRFRDWFALVAPDIHYWMPIRRTVTSDNLDREFTALGDVALYDEDYVYLEGRLRKMEAGSNWAEEPPSRTRHLISNVRVLEVAGDEVQVESCFHLYRSRLETESSAWFGRRDDTLRRHQGSFQIARRHIFLDQTLIRATNMSVLF
ncbi:aromatic-ring-hydroxylating dioxygenase subunit beta [Zavarzinia sp. CC-PAN008]|uniref:aromatic-ring-hydroxylating dioxygenase subunit beta n=1 Tax=Zavarzinia sp. CC-PAN008 TaxID=3243332 RepID=UPI003F74AAB2